jgi:hypothetical protein
VRSLLLPLAKMADDTGAAVLVVRHMNKGGGQNALYRGGGSIGIIGAARAGILAAPDPQDESRRVVAVTKSNLAEMPPALTYRVLATGSVSAPGSTGTDRRCSRRRICCGSSRPRNVTSTTPPPSSCGRRSREAAGHRRKSRRRGRRRGSRSTS